MAQKENKIVLYKDDEGKLSVNTLFADEDVWLTQAQLVDIYQSSKSNISEHLTNIFADKELDKDAVVRKFRTTAADGKNYQVQYYNLDVIIALGYRVQSPIAVRFRRWATRLLHEYIQKGFTMDDERLKLSHDVVRLLFLANGLPEFSLHSRLIYLPQEQIQRFLHHLIYVEFPYTLNCEFVCHNLLLFKVSAAKLNRGCLITWDKFNFFSL